MGARRGDGEGGGLAARAVLPCVPEEREPLPQPVREFPQGVAARGYIWACFDDGDEGLLHLTSQQALAPHYFLSLTVVFGCRLP